MYLHYSARLDIFCIRKLEEQDWRTLSQICSCLFFTHIRYPCRSELQMNADPQYVQMCKYFRITLYGIYLNVAQNCI